MNTTLDSSRHLRHTRLALLSTLFFIGITGCSVVLIWLLRYARWNMRSSRICLLILNLVVANLSVYIFATGIQIGWELQNNRQWPFSDLLCRIVKFFQSCSILSSTYIVVVMAIDRCIAIVTPLRAGKIRVLYLCGSAWALACLLSTPNIFIFQLRINGSLRHCTAVFNLQSTRTARRIYLTFISFVVYFLPFLVIVLCYLLIFIKLWWREQDQQGRLTDTDLSSCCSCFWHDKITTVERIIDRKATTTSSRSSFNDFDARRKRANTYAKARSKTFRMIIVLVLFMVVFGAPYYCLELYIAYTGRKPAEIVLALAGGAAVAPSSIDPWIFLLFWVNWKQPMNSGSSRRLINLSLQQQFIKQRGIIHANTLATSSSSDPRQHHVVVVGTSKTPSYTVRWNSPRKQPPPL